MSFNLTQSAVAERRKTVTRRLGWLNLRPGDRLLAVNRLRVKAIEAEVLGVIEVVSVRREPLSAITCADVIAECVDLPDCSKHGPEVTWPCPYCFIGLFCNAMRLDDPDTEVTRIEFRYVDPPLAEPDPNTRCANCDHRRHKHTEDGDECEQVCGVDDPYCDPYQCDCPEWEEPIP